MTVLPLKDVIRSMCFTYTSVLYINLWIQQIIKNVILHWKSVFSIESVTFSRPAGRQRSAGVSGPWRWRSLLSLYCSRRGDRRRQRFIALALSAFLDRKMYDLSCRIFYKVKYTPFLMITRTSLKELEPHS